MEDYYEKSVRALQLAGKSEHTQEAYTRAVRQLVDFCNKTPDKILEEEVEAYFLQRRNVDKWSPSTMLTLIGDRLIMHLALALRKELDNRLSCHGFDFEWVQIKQDLKTLQTVTIKEDGKAFENRSRCEGVCSKIFQAVGVAIPPSIREI